MTVITDAGFGHSMGVMQALRDRNRKGIFVPRHGNVLAEIVGAENGIGTITSCVGYLRHNITARLSEYRNIQCGPFDVIDQTEQGYFFRDWIVVRVVEEEQLARTTVGTAGS